MLLIGTPTAFVVALLADAACFLVAAVLALILPRVRATGRPSSRVLRQALSDRPYLGAAAVNAVLLLYMPLLSVVLPLWVVGATTAPPAVSAIGFLLNTIGVAAFQARASRRVRDIDGALRSVAFGGALFGAACLAVGGAALPGTPWIAAALILVAVAVQTSGEVLFAAGSWSLGFELASDEAPGAYQAVWAGGIPLARATGPILLAGTMLAVGPLGWIGAAALFGAAGFAMRIPVRAAARLSRGRGPAAR